MAELFRGRRSTSLEFRSPQFTLEECSQSFSLFLSSFFPLLFNLLWAFGGVYIDSSMM